MYETNYAVYEGMICEGFGVDPTMTMVDVVKYTHDAVDHNWVYYRALVGYVSYQIFPLNLLSQ